MNNWSCEGAKVHDRKYMRGQRLWQNIYVDCERKYIMGHDRKKCTGIKVISEIHAGASLWQFMTYEEENYVVRRSDPNIWGWQEYIWNQSDDNKFMYDQWSRQEIYTRAIIWTWNIAKRKDYVLKYMQ